MNEYGKRVAKKMEDYMSNPDSVSEEINDIQNALHGVDVRGALAAGVKKSFSKSESAEGISKNTEQRQDAVEQQFDDVLNEWTSDKPISNEETIAARTNRETGENHKTLGQRLDAENKKVNAQLADTKQELGNADELPSEGQSLTEKALTEFNDRGYNIRWGALMASEDNGDWTRAIQTIYNSLVPGDKLFVPRGRWLVSNLVFDKSDVHFDVQGMFVQKEDATGVCVQLGKTSGRTSSIKIEGILKVERENVDWSIDSTGVQLLNLYESEMTVDIKRFQRGLLLEATLGNGTVYNNINLLGMTDNKIGIDFKAEEIDPDNRGWVNENKFFGGRFGWSHYLVEKFPGENIEEAFERLGCIHINMPSKFMNNNIFFSPSLEGASGKFVFINGNYNTLYSPRLEGGAIKVHFGNDSIYNQVIFPYFTDMSSSNLIDEGTRNKIFGSDYLKMDRTYIGASSFGGDGRKLPTNEHAIFDAFTAISSSRKAFRVRNSQGNETFSVSGNGVVTAQTYAFNTGKIIAPDGSLRDGHFPLVRDGYGLESVKIVAIKNTVGPPATSSPLQGSAILNTADSKLYFHFGGGIWKGVQLS